MNLDYWLLHADSFLHQIFMIVMGILYGLAFIFSVSYKAINIYCYFVLFPLSFAIFLKTPWKFLFLPVSLLFFLIPNFEHLSIQLFDRSVDFLNWSAEIFQSNYIAMSVYICVLVPLLLYLPLIFYRLDRKQIKFWGIALSGILILYLVMIYPFFIDILLYAKEKMHV